MKLPKSEIAWAIVSYEKHTNTNELQWTMRRPEIYPTKKDALDNSHRFWDSVVPVRITCLKNKP